MTVTVQQLQEKAQTVPPDARVFVVGISGEDYPITKLVADGDVLRITVEDELPEPGEDNQDDGDE